MIHIKRFLLVVLLYSFVLVTNSAYSCSCRYFSETEDLEDRILESDKILSGTVMKIEFVKDTNLFFKTRTNTIKTTFVIEKVYKGKIHRDTISIYQQDSNCLFPFKLNKKYLVYSYIERGRGYTDQCTPTVEIGKSKEHVELLNKMKKERRI